MSTDDNHALDKKGTATDETTCERDPHNIVPEGFYKRYPGGIEQARQDATTTPKEDLPRCPECDRHSTNISSYCGSSGADSPAEWKCNYCGARFDEPLSAAEVQETTQATLGEATR